MNRNHSDQYGMNEEFHTKRSERYRHPEQQNRYRFDDYGSPARGSYGNEGHGGTWGNQGNEMGGSRNLTGRDRSGSYSGARNYNSSSSSHHSGYNPNSNFPQRRQDSNSLYHYEAGRGPSSEQRSYGYHSDYDSHGTGYSHDDRPEDLYGSSVSRRFQGSDQGRYDLDRDRSQNRSGMQNSSSYWDRDNFSSPNYGSSEGNYMGSGYNRTTSGNRMGEYGSMGSYDSGSYSRGNQNDSYRSQQRHDPYARDSENTRIQHPDSDYYYDPNHSFDTRKKPDYISSHNRDRTWNRDRSRDTDRF